jgi:hypothetical protein
VTRLPQGKHEDLPWHVCEHANLPIADQPDERKCDHPTKPWHKLVPLWLMSKHVGSEIMDQATPVIAFFNTQNGAWPWIFNDKAMGELITAKPLLTTMAFYTSIKSSLPGLTNNTLLNSLYRKVSEMKKQACEGDSRNMFYGCFIFSSMQRESLHPRHHHSNVLLPHC